jgi:2-polyprenyl-3-methyl-5-hydroxy-6-metoxy-1,4-benzoquinol methylase
MEQLRATRDRVLDQAMLREGEELLDVGCGDGLIALGALERGAALAIFSDSRKTCLWRAADWRTSWVWSTAVSSCVRPPTNSPRSRAAL